jgi:DNA-binding PucR family transcriptional regulator
LAADRDLELLITVECFLDLAGDVKRTSERLMLHRTSVYNRLKRIEAVAGIDLTNGLHRLDLHLGLKTARLAGLITEPPIVDG